MSEVDEDDPYKGLVTGQSMEADRENKSRDNELSHRDDDESEASRPDQLPPDRDRR